MKTQLERYNCFITNGGNAIPKHASPEANGSNPTTGLTLLWAGYTFRGIFNHWQFSRKEVGQIFLWNYCSYAFSIRLIIRRNISAYYAPPHPTFSTWSPLAFDKQSQTLPEFLEVTTSGKLSLKCRTSLWTLWETSGWEVIWKGADVKRVVTSRLQKFDTTLFSARSQSLGQRWDRYI